MVWAVGPSGLSTNGSPPRNAAMRWAQRDLKVGGKLRVQYQCSILLQPKHVGRLHLACQAHGCNSSMAVYCGLRRYKVYAHLALGHMWQNQTANYHATICLPVEIETRMHRPRQTLMFCTL